jgi:hypothetical protein
MKKLFLLCSSILVMQSSSCKDRLFFIDNEFDDFVNRIVQEPDRRDFNQYYTQLMRKYKKYKLKQTTRSLKKYKTKIDELMKMGKAALEVRKPIWAEQIRLASKSLDEKQMKPIRSFFMRYGAYEEFQKNKAAGYNTLWAKTKSYFRDAGNSITGWFSGWRKSKTI